MILCVNRFIEIPSFMHVVHVEQECSGDDRSALQTVLQARAGVFVLYAHRHMFDRDSRMLQADGEREWLLSMEKMLVDEVSFGFSGSRHGSY